MEVKDERSYPSNMQEHQKKDMDEMTYSTIIFHLANNVLRRVEESKSSSELWATLDKLFLVKFLPNKLYLLEQFFWLQDESC